MGFVLHDLNILRVQRIMGLFHLKVCVRAFLCITAVHKHQVTKLLSFVSALNSQKHMKPNNENIRSVTYPQSFSIYLYMCGLHFIKKKGNLVFAEFWFNWLCWKQDLCILIPKMADRWPVCYDNVTKILRIKNVWYQRINCGTFLKLWSLNCESAVL